MKYTVYLSLIICIIVLFILYSHYINNTTINTDLNIQQSEHPNNEVIMTMLNKKYPTLFRYELELWDGFDLLIGQNYEDIINVLKNNKVLENNCQDIYLKPYAPALIKKWDIKCKKLNQNWNTINDVPTLEKSYVHLIACFSGLLTICLIAPNTKTKNKLKDLIKNKHNIKDYISQHPDEIEHITIPIRPSNMIYIPYGWYYYIYSGLEENYTAIFDCSCITYI